MGLPLYFWYSEPSLLVVTPTGKTVLFSTVEGITRFFWTWFYKTHLSKISLFISSNSLYIQPEWDFYYISFKRNVIPEIAVLWKVYFMYILKHMKKEGFHLSLLSSCVWGKDTLSWRWKSRQIFWHISATSRNSSGWTWSLSPAGAIQPSTGNTLDDTWAISWHQWRFSGG